LNTPFLFIILPLFLAGSLLLLRNLKFNTLVACVFSVLLTLVAWLVPMDTILTIGTWSFKLTTTLNVLGRHLILASGDRSLLVLIYGSSTLWFAPSLATRAAHRFIPLGLAITALLVAGLAVDPFLFAALLIEMAVLISIPLLSSPGQKPGRGLIRFLIFQTLAMPFILFSGWLLAGLEANPGNVGLVQQSAILIGLGFAFLLAVFPFYSWIPMISEESSPYAVGFILWIFSTVTLFFGLGFLDRYAWLRDSPSLGIILTSVGVLMIVTGGFLVGFERHLGRIMGYAVIMGNGFSLIAISLGIASGLNLFLMLIIPRVISLLLWSFTLTVLKDEQPNLSMDDLKGLARRWPYAASGLILANLSIAGMPLLACYPALQSIWASLATTSLPALTWVLIGSLGLFISALRTILGFMSSHNEISWGSRETSWQRIFLVIGIATILMLGLFPQWSLLLWSHLPNMFTHLGQ
jgi:NADH-quinone oxidoreductase subunit N